jgi:ribosomal protein S18 acetylase RimI-like enzyme
MIRRAIHDFRRDVAITWSYGGLRELREAFLNRAVHRLYRRETGLLFEEDPREVSEAPPPAGVEVRVLGDRDWVDVADTLTTRALSLFRRQMTPQNTCLVAWRGERLIGYTWLSEPGAPLRGLPLPLPSGIAYGWDLWVDPRERSRGVGSALVRARLACARERGFLRAWRIVIDGNRPALRTLERSSGGRARVLGKVVYVTFLGRRRARYEPGAVN